MGIFLGISQSTEHDHTLTGMNLIFCHFVSIFFTALPDFLYSPSPCFYVPSHERGYLQSTNYMVWNYACQADCPLSSPPKIHIHTYCRLSREKRPVSHPPGRKAEGAGALFSYKLTRSKSFIINNIPTASEITDNNILPAPSTPHGSRIRIPLCPVSPKFYRRKARWITDAK